MKQHIALIFISVFFDISSTASQCKNNEGGKPNATDFTYEDPSEWNTLYVPACDGTRQSPINIVTNNAGIGYYRTPLNLQSYQSRMMEMTLENDGHTVLVTMDQDIVITGGPAGRDSFKLDNFHFHFGQTNREGSEHTGNGISYPLEIHFVHINQKYGSMDTAVLHPDGILVIAVIAEYGYATPYVLQLIANSLINVNKLDTSTTVQKTTQLSGLLPNNGNINSYFTYNGSLTTPSCQEAVIWVVAKDTLTVTDNVLNAFRKVENNCGGFLAGNLRPVQPLNGRKVLFVKY